MIDNILGGRESTFDFTNFDRKRTKSLSDDFEMSLMQMVIKHLKNVEKTIINFFSIIRQPSSLKVKYN